MATFIDSAKILVKAGNGGNGMIAFRREKYVPKGGPYGGDGGNGGSVIFVVDEGLRTLLDFRYEHVFKAQNGENGKSKNMHGKNAPDSLFKVPPGTIIKDVKTGKILGDLRENKQELIVAKGGRGGRGNVRFATAKNPAPHLAENGEPGAEVELDLELKVLADVGLVGFPSVGKSTLLSVISKAKPKIGDFPFTTLTPNLGMVYLKNGGSFVVADLPGLIKGAASGAGLGIQFLRHIERTKIIWHIIDLSKDIATDVFADYLAINAELEQYNLHLLEKVQIIVANKMDTPQAVDNLTKFKAQLAKHLPNKDLPLIFPISGLTKSGLDELLNATSDLLDKLPEFSFAKTAVEQEDAEVYYGYQNEKDDFEIKRLPDASWEVVGEKIKKLVAMTNFEHDETVKRFTRQLRHLGVESKLRKRGAKNGDTVKIDQFSFEFLD